MIRYIDLRTSYIIFTFGNMIDINSCIENRQEDSWEKDHKNFECKVNMTGNEDEFYLRYSMAYAEKDWDEGI